MIEQHADKVPISFAVVNRLSANTSPATTPVTWTRGLKSSGKWAGDFEKTLSIYGNKVGYIAYMNGPVGWAGTRIYQKIRKQGPTSFNTANIHLQHYSKHPETLT